MFEMDVHHKIYAIVGCIYLCVLFVFASNGSHEKFDAISPSDDQLLLIETSTKSFLMQAVSHSVEDNEVDTSGDSMPTTKQQGRDMDPSAILSTKQQSNDLNTLYITSKKQEGTSKPSLTKQTGHVFIPRVNSSTKLPKNNRNVFSSNIQHTSLSTRLPYHKERNNASVDFSFKLQNPDTDTSVTMMTSQLDGSGSDPLIQRSTKRHASKGDTDLPIQVSTKQLTVNDDPSTSESIKETDFSASKSKGKTDPVTMLSTKANVDLLNEFTVKPSTELTQDLHTTKSSANVTTSSNKVLPIPDNVHIKSASEKSLSLSLEPLPSEQSYKIEITSDQVDNYNETFFTAKTEFTISPLLPGVLYKFSVSIVTEKLQGEKFKLENYTVPMAPPLKYISIDIYNDRATLKMLGSGINCDNLHIHGVSSYSNVIYNMGKSCGIYMKNLCAGRKYSISLWQIRDVWKSQPTNMTFATHQQQQRFQYKIHRNILNLTWQQIKQSGCPLVGYKIYMDDNTDGKVYQQPEYTTAVRTGYTYEFKVQPIYKDAIGEKGNPMRITVSNKFPGPVQNFTILNHSATTAQIFLRPPTQKNEDILGYLIITTADKFCQTKVINCTGCDRTNPEINPIFVLPGDCKKKFCGNISMNEVEILSKEFTIENLLPFSQYKMAVTAYNNEGCGNETYKFFTTLESTPSVVRALQVTSVTNNSINLTYNSPKDNNGIILNYTIQACSKIHICRYTLNNNKLICHKFNTTKLEYVLQNLAPNWLYSLSVYAWTSKGFGDATKPINITTKQSVPTQVEDLQITKVTNTSLEFQWERPCFPNGNITKYEVGYETETGVKRSNTTENLAGKFEKLHPYMTYTVKVSACTRFGCSKSYNVTMRTLVGIPINVQNVQANPISSTCVIVSWDKPQDKMGPTNYSVETLDNGKILQGCQVEGFRTTKCTVTGLDEYWRYTFKVIAYTAVGRSLPIESPEVTTLESIPGRVTDLQIGFKCYTRIFVKWEPPTLREWNGNIHKYCISLLEQDGLNKTKFVNKTHRYQEFTVKPERNFTIQVRAVTKVGEGRITEETINIPAGPPVIPEGILFSPASFFAKDRSKQIAILLPMKFFSNDTNGKPITWGLIVAQSEAVNGNNTAVQMARNEFYPKSMHRWEQVHDDDIIKPYRVTAVDWKPPSFHSDDGNNHYILGADEECDMGQYYCNGYLRPGRSYRVKAFMCTRGGCSETRYSGIIHTEKDLSPVYVSTPILITIAVISMAAVLFMWRKQLFCFRKRPITIPSEVSSINKTGETNRSFIMTLEPKSRPIMLDEFHEKVERMKKDSNLLFCEEFQLLRTCSPSKSHSAAELQANRTKNRYTNILAFDHSRVKLLPLDDDEGSDYINANYMPGYQSKREYIAAQGPLPGTKDDFWRMIWEQNVSVVVMVTQAVERGRIKSEIYWPTGTDPVYFGDLVIQLRSESNLSDYILRILDVQLGEQKREVKHFHFLKWPDFGCPANTSLLITFIQTVRLYMPYTTTGPIIIHCSAGVGRTGTFIAIDWLLQHIREHQDVDIFGLILEMRNYRVNMVQTEDQYIFIHQCIADHLRQVEGGSAEENVFMDDTQM